MRERLHRSRFHRDPALVPLRLGQNDLVLLRDLFFYRFADTRSLARTFRWANGGKGLQYFSKRLSQLWRAGYVERFTPAFSRYVHGSRHFLYTIGSGKASAAARTGLRPDLVLEDRWRDVLAEAAPARLLARDALLAIGIDGAEINRVLHNNTVAALRFISGDTSGVKHHALAAEALSAIWFRARMEGHQVEDIQPDGVGTLSFRELEPHRHRDLVTAGGFIIIKPDCMFMIAGQQYALEAETGTSSAENLFLKLRRYARRVSFDPHLRLLVVCASTSHAARARDILQRLPALSPAAEVHVADAP
ncbi:MAG TPA: replication-relaxation family protein [Thermoanaerobaculia bacterium]|nr:replication-relaxation family protein [Thermoanaerobaculia bacterium]